MSVIFGFFASKLGKGALIAIALGLAIWWGVSTWNSYTSGLVEKGHKAGYTAAATKFKDRVEKSREANIALEIEIEEITEKYFKATEKSDTTRVSKEQKQADIIDHRLAELPESNREICSIPQDVIDARNEIRALGPKLR